MRAKPDVAIVAAGAGIGHLVRSCAIAEKLARGGIRSRILTHSLFAEGIRYHTGCDLIFIPPGKWCETIVGEVNAMNPGLTLLDTFPLGIRGEWGNQKKEKRVLVARVLKMED